MRATTAILLLSSFLFVACERNSSENGAAEKPVPHQTMKQVVENVPPLPPYDELDLTTETQWEGPGHLVKVSWVGHGDFGIVVSLADPESDVTRKNYEALRERWPDFINEAIGAIEQQIINYEHQEYAPEPEEDYFGFEVPDLLIEQGAGWEFHINSDPGWVIDLVGWEIVGGQGIF